VLEIDRTGARSKVGPDFGHLTSLLAGRPRAAAELRPPLAGEGATSHGSVVTPVLAVGRRLPVLFRLVQGLVTALGELLERVFWA